MYQDAHRAMYTSLMADGSLIHRLLSPVANRKERNLMLRVLSPLVNIFLKESKKPANIVYRKKKPDPSKGSSLPHANIQK